MTDDLTDTIRTMLDDPPEPAEQFDETRWTAGITRSIHRRRRTRRLAAGSLAAMAVAAGLLVPTLVDSAPQPGGDTVATGPRLPERTITGAIMKMAAASGDSTPSAIRYVRGTRGDLVKHIPSADKLDAVDSATPAVLVQATGTFAITWGELHCSKTATGKQHCWYVEKGNEVFTILDAHTGRVLESGLSPNAIDLASVGTVHEVPVPK